MEIVTWQEYFAYSEMVKYIFLFIGIAAFIYYNGNKMLNPLPNRTLFFLFFLMIWILGAWPMVSTGADRNLYYMEAQTLAQTGIIDRSNDLGYSILNMVLTCFPMDLYFYLHSFLYVLGIFVFAKSILPEQKGVLFLSMILYFQFVSYGVNTMRAGIAGSIFLVAIAYRNKNLLFWGLLFASVMVHKSFALPVTCFLLASKFDRTDLYFKIWLLSIIVSAVAGSAIQQYFALLLGDESRSSYLIAKASETHYKVGFRLDFILFSCAPIVMGYYMIYKRNFKCSLYKTLFNTYLLANTFWILVIRANFSDRFAYLSWIIYSPILVYPLLKDSNLVENPHRWISFIILGMTLFKAYLS